MRSNSFPIYDINGELSMTISCFHDVTDTIEQSRKIEEQKKELEAVIQNISDGIFIFNNKGKYILINKAAREMFFPSHEYSENIGEG